MKEVTLITTFKKHEKQILQNNQMIGALVQDIQQLQQMVSGFLAVLRKLPGYDKAIEELAKANKEAEEKEAAELAAIEVVDLAVVEAPKTLDLGDND